MGAVRAASGRGARDSFLGVEALAGGNRYTNIAWNEEAAATAALRYALTHVCMHKRVHASMNAARGARARARL